ncbi:MAG: hypothetical protein ACMG6E_03080 [Candidatus Roizmanbacteria bacterium]
MAEMAEGRANSMRIIGNTFGREEYKPLPPKEPSLPPSRYDALHVVDKSEGYVVAFQVEIIMWMIIIPSVVLFFLFVMNPEFLRKDEENKRHERHYGKLVLWTLVISIIIWVVLVVFRKQSMH